MIRFVLEMYNRNIIECFNVLGWGINTMLLNADDHLCRYALSTLNAVVTSLVGCERMMMLPCSKYKFWSWMTSRCVL